MLKRFVVIFIGLISLISLIGLIGRMKTAQVTDTGLTYARPSKFKELLVPVYLPPKIINIEKLGINGELGAVGVVDGRIGVPADWQGIGYFVDSSKAGEPGNTIIVGHLDDNEGRPAAFWSIRSLVAGDTVVVGDGHRSFEYRVVGSAYVPDGSSDVLQEDLGGPGLILVTCGGAWNPVTRNYSQRLLVKAVLAI